MKRKYPIEMCRSLFNKKGISYIIGILNTAFVLGQTPEAPSALHHFLIESDNTSASLFWTDNSSDETGFVLERQYDGEDWTEVTSLSSGTSSHELSIADPSKSANYRIKAINGSSSSAYSNIIRLVGTNAPVEVYPEVPGIRDPQMHTIDGITFPEIQYQCPSAPDQGHATTISTFFDVQVRPATGGNFKYSPTYETRPQIRDLRAQDDPFHSRGGHDAYAYGWYGPNSSQPNRTLHSRHWNNFDAETEVTVRISLLETAQTQTIDMAQLEVYPEPISIAQVDASTVDITLPSAGTEELDFSRHYMIVINQSDWEDPSRGSLIFEHPLMIFINPVKIAPGSAPEGTFKTFDGGRLLVMGPGIHLPDDQWRFFGQGANSTTTEMYVPGESYLHGGFALNNTSVPVKVWGRGIYSDELFFVHGESRNYLDRTPWAGTAPAEGNPWNLSGSWEASIFFGGNESSPQTVEGLSSISRRMGSVTKSGGNGVLIDHKDVGYAGGLYQEGDTKSYYLGIYTHNDDDITYMHQDWEMHYSTTRILHNGPSFQFGWAVNDAKNARGRAFNHTVLPPDKRGSGFGQNHGVFNSRLQAGALVRHLGGYFENMTIAGTENIVFNIGVSQERGPEDPPQNHVSVFSDKIFKDITIENAARNDNLLETQIDPGTNQESYIRFLHFDNLVIDGQRITNIDDGDHFDYNEKFDNQYNTNGVLVHTITFFSLPDPVELTNFTSVEAGFTSGIRLASTSQYIAPNYSLVQSLGPLCSTSNTEEIKYQIEDLGNGLVALKTSDGYYVKADPTRYGYVYTLGDNLRDDPNGKTLTEEAKFAIEYLGEQKFALYSQAMKAYVRVEQNSGLEMPLYAASGSIGEFETFQFDDDLILTTTDKEIVVLGSEEIESFVSVYPNPFRDAFKVEIDTKLVGHVTFELLDLSGRTIQRQNRYIPGGLQSFSINTPNLNPGAYLLRIVPHDANHGSEVIRLIKK